MKTFEELREAIRTIRECMKRERTDWRVVKRICDQALETDPYWNPRRSLEAVAGAHSMLTLSLGLAGEVREMLARHLRDSTPEGPACEDCLRPYSDPGFADLVVPNDVFAQVSTNRDENGLFCPSCLIARIGRAGIDCELVALSGAVSHAEPLKRAVEPVKRGPCCLDCARPKSDPGFVEMVVPAEMLIKLNAKGPLCPSCLAARLSRAGFECSVTFKGAETT